MLKKPILWVVVAAAMLLGVACGSTAAPTVEPAPAEAEPTQEEVVNPPSETAEESPEVTEAAEEPTQPEVDADNVEVLHRDNPAPPSSFVADSPEWVAATGRPQLIEFFAYW